jgi:hypothetical protein
MRYKISIKYFVGISFLLFCFPLVAESINDYSRCNVTKNADQTNYVGEYTIADLITQATAVYIKNNKADTRSPYFKEHNKVQILHKNKNEFYIAGVEGYRANWYLICSKDATAPKAKPKAKGKR